MPSSFEIYATTGDVGLNIYGETEKDVFEQAFLGLYSLITDIEKVNGSIEKIVKVSADSIDRLLIKWLNELIYIFDTENFLGCKVHILSFFENFLEAKIYGEYFDEKRHTKGLLIKAATYHNLNFEKKGSKFKASVLFDI